jgi:hypothetical protein
MKIMVVAGLPDNAGAEDDRRLRAACEKLGEAIQRRGHTPVVCSVHPEAAELDLLRGVSNAAGARPVTVVGHLPRHPRVESWLDRLKEQFRGVTVVPRWHQTPPVEHDDESRRYAYLTCQLLAADECSTIVALGGGIGGAMSLFLTVESSRHQKIVPLTFLGGAARDHFWRSASHVGEVLGERAALLADEERVGEVVGLAERLAEDPAPSPEPDRYFIAYSRKRDEYADVAENVLLNNGAKVVFRDKNQITVGDPWKAKIADELDASAVVVVLWSQEFACSPHCFVEMEQTLRRRQRSADPMDRHPALWIFKLDDTRMTFPDVEDDAYTVSCGSREELRTALTLKINEPHRDRRARS